MNPREMTATEVQQSNEYQELVKRLGGDTPRARTLSALLEKAEVGLLAPSETARLSEIVERAAVLIGEERGFTRLQVLDWLADDNEDWTWS